MTTEIRIALYALLVAAIFATGTAFGYRHWYSPEHEAHLKDNATAAAFQAQVAENGKQAELDKQTTEKRYADAIQTAQNDASAAQRKLDTWVSKHANNSPSERFLPSSPAPLATSDRTGQVCYDANALDAALRQFAGDVQSVVGSGSQAVIDRHQILQSWPK